MGGSDRCGSSKKKIGKQNFSLEKVFLKYNIYSVNWIAYLQYRKGNTNQYGWAKFSFSKVRLSRALNVFNYI